MSVDCAIAKHMACADAFDNQRCDYLQSCEFGDIVDETVNDNPEVAFLVVLGNLTGADLFALNWLLLLLLRCHGGNVYGCGGRGRGEKEGREGRF